MFKMLRDFWEKIERITYHEEDEATVEHVKRDECCLLPTGKWISLAKLHEDHVALADAVHGIHGTVNVDAERIRQLEITQASLIEFIDRMIDAKNAEIRVLARIETKPTRVDLDGLLKAVGEKTDGK